MEYNFEKRIFGRNECVIRGVPITPCGVMVHSTGANNPRLSRYIPSWDVYHAGGKDIGPHKFIRDPNRRGYYCKTCGGRQACVHGFIGRRPDGTVSFIQTAPWTIKTWHSGRGKVGSANDMGYIGFEICEDNLEDPKYFKLVYDEAVKLVSYLCTTFGWDPMEDGRVICHCEGHSRGIASNHADVLHWFRKHGKDMDTFRNDVSARMVLPDAPDRYNRFEELPEYSRPYIDQLIKEGRLSGKGGPRDKNGRPTDMDLSIDMIRLIVMLGKR